MADNYDNKTKGAGLGAALIALVVGGAGGYAIGNSMSDDESKNGSSSSSQATTATPASDLRAMLTGLQEEHVSLASAATRAGFDGSAMFEPAAASLDNNSKDLQKSVASVYGDEAGDKFYEIWKSHIGFFVDYTVAAKAGDQAGMDKAVQNLAGYVDAISTFFSDANPNLPKEAVSQLISEHVTLLKDTVDKYGAGDIAGSYAKQRETRAQIGNEVAATISGAIVKQYPDKFKQQ